jgi:hypothetical protein
MAHLDSSIRRDLARAALLIAGGTPWREVTLIRLADVAARPVSDFYGASLWEAVDCVEEAFDRAIADNLDELDPKQSVRDRLFELIMRRFEAMEPHRAAVLAMEQGHGSRSRPCWPRRTSAMCAARAGFSHSPGSKQMA